MVFIPYQSFLIHTDLSHDQIIERLSEVIDQEYLKKPFQLFKENKKPFSGKIKGESFVIYYDNPEDFPLMAPHVICGQIATNVIQVKIRLPYLVLGFLILFLTTGISFLPGVKGIGDFVGIIFILGFGYSIFTGGLVYKAKKAKEILERLFKT